MDKTRLALALFSMLAAPSFAQAPAEPPAPSTHPVESRTFDIRQSVTLNQIPKTTRNVRLWISIPDDHSAQRVLDIAVASAPATYQIVRDRDGGSRFLYMEVKNPKAESLTTTVDFSIERSAVSHALDAAKATALNSSQKAIFAEELRVDAPHMEVTEHIRKMVDEVVGDEKNPVVVSGKLLNHVADIADHYSKNPNVPTCGVGDAGSCVAKGGGCCSDLHSLFIAMARGAGIPARLQMGYRLQPKNAGVEADPGYRCWAEYFLAGYGWIPADIVEADAGDAAGRTHWLTGLTDRRVHLNEGRNFDLPFKKHPARVNLMTIGYAEIDGNPVRVLPEGDKQPQLVRTVKYTERLSSPPLAVSQTDR